MFLLYVALVGLIFMIVGLFGSVFFGVLMSKTVDVVSRLLKAYMKFEDSDPLSDDVDELIHSTKEILEQSYSRLPVLVAVFAISLVATLLGLVVFATGILGQVWMLSSIHS